MVAMQYLSSHTIYNELIEGMRANGVSMDTLALELYMTHDELAALLTPTHDYTISEIKDLLGALYLDIKVEIVPD